jgi:hypothetical protein
MYLCYINKLGPNHRGELIYEFIFTNDIINVNGDDWDRFPANGYPSLPHTAFMDSVLTLKTFNLDLKLARDNDFLTYKDCQDGIIAIGWEEDYKTDRLVLRFGDELDTVKNIFYKKDLFLENVN